MGFICFKCKRSLGPNIRALFSHLRVVHHVFSTSSYFQCAQAGCHRTFSIIRSFRRHLLEHVNDIGNEMGETPLVEPDNLSNSVLDAVEQCDEDCDKIAEEQFDELEEENIQDRVALFLAKLRSNSSQTLSTVNFVVDHTSSLISDVVGSLQRNTVSFLREIGHSESPGTQKLLEHFACAAQPFQGFESEYKQMQYFTQSGCFVQPEEIPLPGFSYTQQRDTLTGTVRQVAVRDTFQRVPLKPLLKQVLESPGTMEKIFEWQNQESTGLADFKDGTIFKTN